MVVGRTERPTQDNSTCFFFHREVHDQKKTVGRVGSRCSVYSGEVRSSCESVASLQGGSQDTQRGLYQPLQWPLFLLHHLLLRETHEEHTWDVLFFSPPCNYFGGEFPWGKTLKSSEANNYTWPDNKMPGFTRWTSPIRGNHVADFSRIALRSVCAKRSRIKGGHSAGGCPFTSKYLRGIISWYDFNPLPPSGKSDSCCWASITMWQSATPTVQTGHEFCIVFFTIRGTMCVLEERRRRRCDIVSLCACVSARLEVCGGRTGIKSEACL